ncbi:L-fucose:H+ symporter permease [Pedobacter steynii]|uniref:alpha-L-fucosidase n=1 Tax=Pedobacter steynii TaxID=430522 RepID=A0A1G9Z6H0_9SPHI|nr:L-fucose:H+ symporter permease [Pedobacter steynii]SDN17032.1 L-fucose:H+ symporter permease [Pedobacter steynii]
MELTASESIPHQKEKRKVFLGGTVLVISLFFLWALTANLLPILIPHLKKACQLTVLESSLIDSAYWIAYFVIAIPAGLVMKRFGYKKAIITGLLLAAIGAFLFYPAAESRSFVFFLFALFVLASGMTFLETSANPFMTILGDPATASGRLNFAQAFNGLGAFIASMFLSKLIIGKELKTGAELDLLSPEALDHYYSILFHKLKFPYLLIGGILVMVALLFMLTKFAADHTGRKNGPGKKISFTAQPQLLTGIITQFFYVGAQVCVSSFFILYATSVSGMTEYEATNYLGLLLLSFMLGRYLGTFIMKYVAAAKLLWIYALISLALMLFIVLAGGKASLWAFISLEFFMSIMYPTIFALAIKDLGEETPIGSSYMVMAIIGGAVFPPILGYLSDLTGSIRIAYIVPLICFIPVAYFGWQQRRKLKLNPITLVVLLLLISSGTLHAQRSEPKPYGAVPTKAQLKWHDTELYALVCFGLNTYTDKEWGYGDVSPSLFNPSDFDPSQITAVLKEAGFKGLLLVAKHHDGFCLWPTKTTPYSVAASPWMNGKGDVVKSFELASRKEGLRFGLYNSPWDRNSAAYGSPAYIKIYQDQLKELHRNYGPLFISWYDGANGGDGYYGGAKETRQINRAEYYRWKETWAMVKKLQPDAVIFSDIGPDVRWVGNEKGFAAETSWATFTPKGEKEGEEAAPGASRYEEAPGGNRNGRYWIPAECDVPLRSGWYYHAAQDNSVKSPYELFDIYFKSVGRGAALDLGIAPDKRGMLHENDVAALKGFGKLLKETFSVNLLEKAEIQASNTRGRKKIFSPQHLIDGDKNTYWSTDDTVRTPEFTIKLKEPTTFNIIRLKEYIALGQRIESFAVDIWKNEEWQELTQGSSIGSQRLIRLPYFVSTDKIRVRILSSPVCPVLTEFAVFAEPQAALSAITMTKTGILPLATKGWTIPIAPGESNKLPFLLDGKPTIWEGPFGKEKLSRNAIVMDMGKIQEISGLLFTPVSETFGKGIPKGYKLDISMDGQHWTEVGSGEFGNIYANPVQQQISLLEKRKTRFIRFTVTRLCDDGELMRIAEIAAY